MELLQSEESAVSDEMLGGLMSQLLAPHFYNAVIVPDDAPNDDGAV